MGSGTSRPASGRPSTAAAKIVVQPAAFPLPEPGNQEALDGCSIGSERTPPLQRRSSPAPRGTSMSNLGPGSGTLAPSALGPRASSPRLAVSSAATSSAATPTSVAASGAAAAAGPSGSASTSKSRLSAGGNPALFDDHDGASSTRTLVLEDWTDPVPAPEPPRRASVASNPKGNGASIASSGGTGLNNGSLNGASAGVVTAAASEGEPAKAVENGAVEDPIARFRSAMSARPRAPLAAVEEDTFDEFAQCIFEGADRDRDGLLNAAELLSVLQSPTLALGPERISTHFEQMRAECPGGMGLDDFFPMLRALLISVYATADREWCQIGYSSYHEDALPLFLHCKTGRLSYNGPATAKQPTSVSVVDAQQRFELFARVSDGAMITTFVDENGQRQYLDSDTQAWAACGPEDQWRQTHRPVSAASADQRSDQRDESFGTFVHPATGLVYRTCTASETHTVPYYFDEGTSQWRSMPAAWEGLDANVTASLRQLDRLFPKWQNVTEQLLALRAHNYDVNSTIGWKRAEMEAGGGEGSLTVADTVLIASMEDALKRKTDQIQELKKKQQASQVIMDELENENSAMRRELDEARTLVMRQQQRIFALEDQLTDAAATRADPMAQKAVAMMMEHQTTRIRELEVQLHSTREGGAAAMADLLAAKNAELDRMHADLADTRQRLAAAARGPATALARLQFELTTLQKKNERLKIETKDAFAKARAMISRLDAHIGGISGRATRAVAECEELRGKYQRECMQRKLLYNKIQEMRGNIRVFCRCRRDDRVSCSLTFLSDSELLVPVSGKPDRVFEFDRVYGPGATQGEVYEDASAIITSCIDGYNVCFLAYGQTGSGKTFTMMGPGDDRTMWGVNRRAVAELFDNCSKRTDSVFELKISMLEVYNESIYDLLAGAHESLKIRMAGEEDGPNYVEGLSEWPVREMTDVTRALEEADRNRSVAATKMNSHSSRSHLLLAISVTGTDKITNLVSRGKLTLVDLAGSERVAKSEATGQRLTEAAAINKSLSALGMVFQALASGAKHIPYRNSKLTHLLEDSIGGDAKTCMFVNVSPAESNLPETLSTLVFGQNITKIELGPLKKNVVRGPGTK